MKISKGCFGSKIVLQNSLSLAHCTLYCQIWPKPKITTEAIYYQIAVCIHSYISLQIELAGVCAYILCFQLLPFIFLYLTCVLQSPRIMEKSPKPCKTNCFTIGRSYYFVSMVVAFSSLSSDVPVLLNHSSVLVHLVKVWYGTMVWYGTIPYSTMVLPM